MFQSAPPVRGATVRLLHMQLAFKVSIRAPREGSDLGSCRAVVLARVSIRAPREGSDP